MPENRNWTYLIKIVLQHLITLTVITGIAVAVILLLAPNVKVGREEARTLMAYADVQRLQHEYVGEAAREPGELEESDPWGNAYAVQMVDDGQIRVTSAGRDGQFEFSDADSDDIWSGMASSPMKPFQTRRNREWLRAFSAGFIVWCVFAGCYWWSVRTGGDRCATPR